MGAPTEDASSAGGAPILGPSPNTGAAGPAPLAPAPRPALADELASVVRVLPDFPREGDRFPDVTPLFQTPDLFRRVVHHLATEAEARGAEAIAGVDPRGIVFGPLLALRLGLPFVPVAAPGTLPGAIRMIERRGEGAVPLRLAIQRGRLRAGDRVVLVDDLLVTGRTAATAAGLVEDVGGIVAGLLFVVEDPRAKGRRALGRYNVFSLLTLNHIT